jgi:hypothetical protein
MFKWLLKRKIKKMEKACRQQRAFRNLDAIQSFLVFFEASEYAEARQAITLLENNGKQVTAFGYVRKGDATNYTAAPYRMLYPKTDYNFMGYPSGKVIRALRAVACDAILDLTLKENLTIACLSSSLPHPFRAGLKKNGIPSYDLSISLDDESLKKQTVTVTYLSEQIIHYLQTIRME